MSLPETMRAVRITEHGGPEVLEPVEVAVPAPQAGEVLVEVRAVALNNTDPWTRAGAYGRPGDPDAPSGWRGPSRRADLHPVIAATFPLDQAAQAQEELARRDHVGKIVRHPQDV